MNISFKDEVFKELMTIAKEEGCSVATVVSIALEKLLTTPDAEIMWHEGNAYTALDLSSLVKETLNK